MSLPRDERGYVILHCLKKPHIAKRPKDGKWVCINAFGKGVATTPTYAYKAYLRSAKWRQNPIRRKPSR